ncbi:phosphoenolpyruvate-protein phosphotransferase [Vibrio sp. qd031]|uniref:phosphoenolpyruvate--protein phosphotransferase n=1 Tax=Vibrio sp. qd031 TaxID=1603038 RepID=UPI000A11CEE2|nr:phosphoenolpyruvate--protein phosphotransferase [Vibrio sp. qd031]ORT49170.1 phosphoenolpyruvate-protein phosphotransferase [Vibrio sp. qd031]
MLNQLRDIVEHVSRVEDVYQALEVFVNETQKAVHTECCTVYLANDSFQRLELMATKGLTYDGETIHIPYSEGLVGLVKRSAEPINIAKAQSHSAFKYFPQLGEEVYQAFLGTPIIYRKQVLGVVVLQQRDSRQFSETEEAFLVTLAAQLAVIIAHAREQGHWLIDDKGLNSLNGIAASPGVAIGPIWREEVSMRLHDVLPASTINVERELEWMAVTIENALIDFRRMRKKLDGDINKDALAIFDLYTHLLNDPMLRGDLKKQIQKGDSADWALRQIIEAYSNRFLKMSDAYLRERAQDIRELGERLLFFLHNSQRPQFDIDKPVIVVVRELTATLLAAIPKKYLLAVVSQEGATNSHAAILSRALGVPAVMGVGISDTVAADTTAIIDGYSGEVFIDPPKAIIDEYDALYDEEKELSSLVDQDIALPSQTLDGRAITLLLNAGLSADSSIAINAGVTGVGLYRTEISFILKQRFPSEEEQVNLYGNVLEAYSGQSVVMRTLDVGGDKSLPYLPIQEENPFLGWRGIRFTLDHPDIFLIQIRAMLVASIQRNNLSILLPMISNMQELDDSLELIEQAFTEVKEQYPNVRRPRIGVMIEVPSMLYLVPQLAQSVDFVSVGTNDLTQYLLAVDRNNTKVANVYESVHPSVLRALKLLLDSCQQHNLPISICGELAGDPVGAILLVGMGYQSLSMNSANVGRIKYVLRHVEHSKLERLNEQVMSMNHSSEIHQHCKQFLEQQGLAGFVRAGKS